MSTAYGLTTVMLVALKLLQLDSEMDTYSLVFKIFSNYVYHSGNCSDVRTAILLSSIYMELEISSIFMIFEN